MLNAWIAIKNGDFSLRLPVDWTGVNGNIADTFNQIVSQNDRITKTGSSGNSGVRGHPELEVRSVP